jgi:glyoxylase-like metal-dependent hydrolase (beta-lactamase superfamily II)
MTEKRSRASVVRTFVLGELQLTYVPDGEVQLHPRLWLPNSTDADWADGTYLDDSGYLVAGIGGLLVTNGERTLLIDAGLGPVEVSVEQTIAPLGALRGGELPANLASLGHPADSVDALAFTHLHDDHVGWAFRAGPDGRPMFPRAIPAAAAAEWRGFGRPTDVVRELTDGEEVFPGVTARVTGGHTSGHTCFEVVSGGRRLIAFGDLMHSPAQLANPQWQAVSDSDPVRAVGARTALIETLREPNTWGFGGHFADVVFGRVVADGMRSRWEPVA